MDKQYKDINSLVNEILDVFYIFAPTFLLVSFALLFKDEILSTIMHLSSILF